MSPVFQSWIKRVSHPKLKASLIRTDAGALSLRIRIGRGLICAGLLALSVVGALAASGLDEIPQVTLTAACLFNSFGGVIALSSLGAFRGYAACGVALAGAAFLYLQNSAATSSSKIGSAIAIEASVMMVGLLIVSTVLILVRDYDNRAPDL